MLLGDVSIDPFGLWKFSLEAYIPPIVPLIGGLGGGFSIGENPDKQAFVTARLGYGFGGGISFDLIGTSPDYNPCIDYKDTKIGFYGNLSAGFATAKFGLETYAGTDIYNGTKKYNKMPKFAYPSLSNISSFKNFNLSYSGGVGIELIIH